VENQRERPFSSARGPRHAALLKRLVAPVLFLLLGAVLIMTGARLLFRHLTVHYGQAHVPTWLGLLILLALLAILPLVVSFNED
jgi:hypothetical protein